MKKKLEVIFEDNHLLVVNKPSLLATMGVAQGQDSLIAQSKEYLKQKYNKPGKVFLAVVSRLDSFVSGVIVFGRTSKAAARLNKQFADSLASKKYWAIVPSSACGQQESLSHWLCKDEANHRMMHTTAQHPGAKKAELNYRRLGEFEDKSLIEINLITGRKHQIRVQMSATRKAIVGDRKYGSRIPFRQGIALHSYQLQIEHPTLKQLQTYTQPPPDWWGVDKFLSGNSH